MGLAQPWDDLGSHIRTYPSGRWLRDPLGHTSYITMEKGRSIKEKALSRGHAASQGAELGLELRVLGAELIPSKAGPGQLLLELQRAHQGALEDLWHSTDMQDLGEASKDRALELGQGRGAI